MSDINYFYNSILNIRNNIDEGVIGKIVTEERDKLLGEVSDLSGFCKYIASQIQERLRTIGINTYYIDLNDLVGIDHVILIAEGNGRKFLIDPTFSQYYKKDNHKLVLLSEWPSEKIDDKTLVSNLLNMGCTDINNSSFNMYINAFSSKKMGIDLDNYLLERRLDNLSK